MARQHLGVISIWPLSLLLAALVCRSAAQWTYTELATVYEDDFCEVDNCGTASPACGDAEFVSRAIAAGGCLPMLSANSPQEDYCHYMPEGGDWDGLGAPGAYDLCNASKQNPATPHDSLYEYLVSAGWTHAGTAPSSVVTGAAVFGDNGGGAWSHVCIGRSSQMVSCHEPSQCVKTLALAFAGELQAVLLPPASCTGATRTPEPPSSDLSSSSSGTDPPRPHFISASSSSTGTLPPSTTPPPVPTTKPPPFVTTGDAPRTSGPPPLPDDGRKRAMGAAFLAVTVLLLCFIAAALLTAWISRNDLHEEEGEQKEPLKEPEREEMQVSAVNPLFDKRNSAISPMYEAKNLTEEDL